jgi:hypothetical protein
LDCLNSKPLETGRILAHIRTMPENRLKRPRDPAQLAKLMIDIASGEVEDREPTPEERGVDPAASAMGKKGGPARADSMSPERRAQIAKKAAEKRWRK